MMMMMMMMIFQDSLSTSKRFGFYSGNEISEIQNAGGPVSPGWLSPWVFCHLQVIETEKGYVTGPGDQVEPSRRPGRGPVIGPVTGPGR